ncbi:MAG: hypothetical protein OT643_14970, partial [Bacteroidetes bacterium]|nr:hypothetical protein [Bacteroidota bacterium]
VGGSISVGVLIDDATGHIGIGTTTQYGVGCGVATPSLGAIYSYDDNSELTGGMSGWTGSSSGQYVEAMLGPLSASTDGNANLGGSIELKRARLKLGDKFGFGAIGGYSQSQWFSPTAWGASAVDGIKQIWNNIMGEIKKVPFLNPTSWFERI